MRGFRTKGKAGNVSEVLWECYQILEDFFGPQGWWPADNPFEIVVGAILTQNTSWSNAVRALENLKAGGRLTPSDMKKLNMKDLARFIKPAGYYRQKARKLKAFLEFFEEKYGSDFDRMFSEETNTIRNELLQIWGIGPETADSILLYAGHKPVFVVDAYTSRIFNCLGLVSGRADYDEIQVLVGQNLPQDEKLLNEFHALLVRLGKVCCRKEPRCEECPLSKFKVRRKVDE